MPRRYDWSRDDFGSAMARAVVQFGSPRCVKRVGRRVYTNGWWREGEHPNVVVNTETASFFDFKESTGGGVSRFAEVAFNLRLPAFMDRFGLVGAMEPPPAPLPAPKPRDDVEGAWEALSGAGGPVSAAWLRTARGVEATACVSGFADLTVGALPAGDIQRFASRILQPAIVLPLRDARGIPRNLHFRPHGHGGRRFLPGPLVADGAPLGYGMVHQALDAELLVLVEGAIDTLAAEAMLAGEPDAVVVGMASSSMAKHWMAFLRKKQRGSIIVVPHLDPPPHVGQRAAASIVASLTSCDVPCAFFDWDRFHDAVGCSAKDVADATKAVGSLRARAAFADAISRGLP